MSTGTWTAAFAAIPAVIVGICNVIIQLTAGTERGASAYNKIMTVADEKATEFAEDAAHARAVRAIERQKALAAL